MSYVFESLYNHQLSQATEAFEEPKEEAHPNQVQNQQLEHQWSSTIKMMDTILFQNGFQPKKWIFTDLLGRIQFKDINSITINDVIRAFLVNLNENKKNEFNNEDLMQFLADNNNRSKICFAIVGNDRHFLDIGTLSDIKNKFNKGIDALQLYKIPTRNFLPYFYYHTLQFKNNGLLQSHMVTRVSHFIKDLGTKSQRQAEFYEEKIPNDEYDFFAFQMLEISKQLIGRIQQRDQSSIVKTIKITYLIESNNFDPWFIGTEYCYLFMKQNQNTTSRSATNQSKSLINFHRGSLGGRVPTSYNYLQNSTKKSFVSKLKSNIDFHRKQQDNSQLQISPPSLMKEEGIQALTIEKSHQILGLQEQEEEEDIYELSNNKYVTQTDLLKGLQQIGEQYGRQREQNLIKRPKTMQVLSQEKSRRMLQYQQQIQDQRNKLKEKGRRIVQLFPKYLEKSGSKPHAQFLFGNASSERVFKDYQRLRFQKQLYNNNNDSSIMKSDVQASKTSQSFFGAPNKSIFEIPLSEVNPTDKTQITMEHPYRDNYYEQHEEVLNHQTDEDHSQNDQLILNKDISIFQYQNQSVFHQTDNLSIKESIISASDIQTNNHQGFRNKTPNRFLNQSILESHLKDQAKLQLADSELEKDVISLLLMNEDLDNVVVLDKKKAIAQIQEKIREDNLKIQKQKEIHTQSDNDQVFGAQRRKLNQEEAKTYYQWRQQLREQMMQEQNSYKENDTEQSIAHKKGKRSYTATGQRKKSKGSKPSVLSLIQIQGKEAKIESQKQQKTISKKRYLIPKVKKEQILDDEDSSQLDQGKEKKEQGIQNINLKTLRDSNRSSVIAGEQESLSPKQKRNQKGQKQQLADSLLQESNGSNPAILRIIQDIKQSSD